MSLLKSNLLKMHHPRHKDNAQKIHTQQNIIIDYCLEIFTSKCTDRHNICRHTHKDTQGKGWCLTSLWLRMISVKKHAAPYKYKPLTIQLMNKPHSTIEYDDWAYFSNVPSKNKTTMYH